MSAVLSCAVVDAEFDVRLVSAVIALGTVLGTAARLLSIEVCSPAEIIVEVVPTFNGPVMFCESEETNPVRVGATDLTTFPVPVVAAKEIWLELFVPNTELGASGSVTVVPLIPENSDVPVRVGLAESTTLPLPVVVPAVKVPLPVVATTGTLAPMLVVIVDADAVENVAVPVNVGPADMAKVLPVPVWLPMEVALPEEVIGPVKFAFVVTFPAVSPEAVPEIFVPTRVDGVPRFGVTKVGLVASTRLPVPVVVAATSWLEEFVATG